MVLLGFYVFYKGYRTVAYNFFFKASYVRMEIGFTVFFAYVLIYDVVCYDGLQRIVGFVEKGGLGWVVVGMGVEWGVLGVSVGLRLGCIGSVLGWHMAGGGEGGEGGEGSGEGEGEGEGSEGMTSVSCGGG